MPPPSDPRGPRRFAISQTGLHRILDEENFQLERLCRYVSRPPVASERLALTASGQVRYTLKTPYRDGTTHIVLEPLDLMARLAALVISVRFRVNSDPAELDTV